MSAPPRLQVESRPGEPVQTHSGTEQEVKEEEEEEAGEGEETFTGCATLREARLRKHRGKPRRVRVKHEGKTASALNGGNTGLLEPLGDQQLIHLCCKKNKCSRMEDEVGATD